MPIAAIALALTLQSGPSYKIGGDTVSVQVPTWSSPTPLDTYEFNGWKYGFRHGQLVAKAQKGFDWEDVPATAPSGSAAKKKVLINLTTRIDTVIDRGFSWQRQATLFSDDFRAVKREVALFCHLVHTQSAGRVEVEPTWRVDESLRFVDSAEDLGAKYLETFINATDSKPAEGLGPFDSTLVLSPAFGRQIVFGKLDSSFTASIPIYAYFDRSRPGQLARAMYSAWLAAPTGGALEIADPVGSGPLPLEHFSDWRDAAWQRLPAESDSTVSGGSGTASLLINGNLWVRPGFADLFAAKLNRAPKSRYSGWAVFDGQGLSAGQTEAQKLGVSPSPIAMEVGPPQLPFTPGQAEQVPISGSFAIKTSADPDRGSVGELKEMAIRRLGWVRLLGPFDGTGANVIEFWLKPRGTVWPVNIVVVGDGETKVFRMFGSMEAVSGIPPRYSEEGSVELDVKADPVWQRVAFTHGLKNVEGVYLATPAYGDSDEMLRTGLPSLLLDDVAAKASASGDLTGVKPPTTSPGDTALTRAQEARSTTDEAVLLKLLSDPSDAVQLNAALRFSTLKNAAAVPALTLIARNYNPRLAKAGAEALAFQASEAAIGALRYNYQSAIGDFVKEFSADVMPVINERKILSELALALNARRPEARASAARALGRQPFKEASMVMLSFLSDVEPVVRASAIGALAQKDASTLQRVIGFARNDPSDYVRARAFMKLKEWGAPEAAEISKDPSPRVRAAQ